MIPGLKRHAFNFHDVMMYVAIARKHIRLMLLLLCFCLTGGLIVYVFARPVYYSRATVRMDSLALPLDAEKLMHDSNVTAVLMQLTSKHVLERTAKQLGVESDYRDIERDFLKKVSAKVNSQRNIEIEVWPYTYEWAEKWPELLVREFLKDREEQRIKYRETVVNSYGREMSDVSKKLDQNLGDKFDFQNKRDVVKAQIELNQIKQLPREIVLIRKRLTGMDDIKKRVEDPSLDIISKLALISSLDKDVEVNVGQVVGAPPSDAPADGENKNVENPGRQESGGLVVVPAMVSGEKPWEALEKEQRRLHQELAEMETRYLPGHPKMLAIQKQMDDVNKHLELEYETAKTRFDLDFANLTSRQRDLEAKLPEYHAISRKNEKIQQDATLYSAGQLAWVGMYGDMAKQVSALDFAALKERVNIEFIGMNEIKTTPVSPNKMHIFMLAIMAGLGLAVGVPFLIEYLDHTVSNIEQIEATFRMRGLGIIPKIGTSETSETTLLDEGTGLDRNLIENFRVIRTNLLSVGSLTKIPQVIMVTSAMPKEGKTVVSSNLSISFAHTGARTLVLDTDLRRGRLHRVFGLRKSPGLSDVLLGQVSIEDAIRPTNKENLSILTAGQHLDSGTELLGAKRFDDLMETLRGRFERIIVDTPPVLGLSETSILQRNVDGVMFVVWSGRTPLRNMKTAIEMLQSNGANFYGFILNRLDLSATTNYYQYYYYSNDYYHNYHALENA